MTLSFAIILALRYLLVILFLRFRALDKTLNFNGAGAQAREAIPSDDPSTNVEVAIGFDFLVPLLLNS
jgi:hypothetical protein